MSPLALLALEDPMTAMVHGAPSWALAVAGLVAVGVGTHSYVIAHREGREWSFLSMKMGMKPPANDTRPASVPPPAKPDELPGPAKVNAHVVNALLQAGSLAAVARNQVELQAAIEKMLFVLVEHSRHDAPTVLRRASVLRLWKVEGEVSMQRWLGHPKPLFSGPSHFPLKDWEQYQRGLCWHAAMTGKNAWKQTKQTGAQHYSRVESHASFTRIDGHHSFKSILIAPVIDGAGEVLGVVCLDAAEEDFYPECDATLVTMVASLLAIIWDTRNRKAAA